VESVTSLHIATEGGLFWSAMLVRLSSNNFIKTAGEPFGSITAYPLK
jgi:hypothetical protein